MTVINIICFYRYDFTPTEDEKENIKKILGSRLIKEDSFVKTASIHNPNARKAHPMVPILNPQTVQLCEKLGIDDPVQVIMARSGRTMKQPHNDVTTISSPQNEDTHLEVVSEQSPVVQTPIKSKLSLILPEPVTPIESEHTPNMISPQSKAISDNIDNLIYESRTPMSKTRLTKAFKRRNLSIYNTPEVDESVSTESSSLLDSDSPRSSKFPCKDSKSSL